MRLNQLLCFRFLLISAIPLSIAIPFFEPSGMRQARRNDIHETAPNNTTNSLTVEYTVPNSDTTINVTFGHRLDRTVPMFSFLQYCEAVIWEYIHGYGRDIKLERLNRDPFLIRNSHWDYSFSLSSPDPMRSPVLTLGRAADTVAGLGELIIHRFNYNVVTRIDVFITGTTRCVGSGWLNRVRYASSGGNSTFVGDDDFGPKPSPAA